MYFRCSGRAYLSALHCRRQFLFNITYPFLFFRSHYLLLLRSRLSSYFFFIGTPRINDVIVTSFLRTPFSALSLREAIWPRGITWPYQTGCTKGRSSRRTFPCFRILSYCLELGQWTIPVSGSTSPPEPPISPWYVFNKRFIKAMLVITFSFRRLFLFRCSRRYIPAVRYRRRRN